MFTERNPVVMGLLSGLMLAWTGPGLLAQSPTVTEIAEGFTLKEPYRPLEFDLLQDALTGMVDRDSDSVFLPGANLGPLTRTRWVRIRAAATSADGPPVLELSRFFERW